MQSNQSQYTLSQIKADPKIGEPDFKSIIDQLNIDPNTGGWKI